MQCFAVTHIQYKIDLQFCSNLHTVIWYTQFCSYMYSKCIKYICCVKVLYLPRYIWCAPFCSYPYAVHLLCKSFVCSQIQFIWCAQFCSYPPTVHLLCEILYYPKTVHLMCKVLIGSRSRARKRWTTWGTDSTASGQRHSKGVTCMCEDVCKKMNSVLKV